MKQFAVASTVLYSSLFPVLAQASDSIPGLLPEGKYDVVCTSMAITKYPDRGTVRRVNKTIGTSLISVQDGIYIEKSSTVTYSQDKERTRTKDEGLTQIEIKMLAKDHYQLNSKITGRWAWDGNDGRGFVEDESYSEQYSQVVRVQDGIQVALLFESKEYGVQKAAGETTSTKLQDGSIIVSTMSREPRHWPQTKTEEGTIPERTLLASQSTCTYKPGK